MGVICNMTSPSNSSQSTCPTGQDECFVKNYPSFSDFTLNYDRTSVIFSPGYKTFNAQQSTQLNMKFIVLVNVTMPAITGILTFSSMINYTSKTASMVSLHVYIFMSS